METSTLLAFRNELYRCFSARPDALMTMADMETSLFSLLHRELRATSCCAWQKTGFYTVLLRRDLRNAVPDSPEKTGTNLIARTLPPMASQARVGRAVPEKGQSVTADSWEVLHFKDARDIEVSLIRIMRSGVEDTRRSPSVFRLLFCGKECPKLSEVGSVYGCRYHIEHGFRFKKQDKKTFFHKLLRRKKPPDASRLRRTISI